MSIFERYLSLWVALAMVAGICLGNVAPGLVAAIAAARSPASIWWLRF